MNAITKNALGNPCLDIRDDSGGDGGDRADLWRWPGGSLWRCLCAATAAPSRLSHRRLLLLGCAHHHQPLRGQSACAGRGTALPAGKQVQTQLLSPLVTPLSHISPSLKLVSVGIKSCLIFLDTFLKLKTHPPCQLL